MNALQVLLRTVLTLQIHASVTQTVTGAKSPKFVAAIKTHAKFLSRAVLRNALGTSLKIATKNSTVNMRMDMIVIKNRKNFTMQLGTLFKLNLKTVVKILRIAQKIR